MYAFIDESGDLGFSKGSSRCFIVALLIAKEPNKIRKVVRNVKKTLGKKWKKVVELKANKSNSVIRTRLLKQLAKEDIEITYLFLDKQKIRNHLRDKKHKLFNWLCGILLSKYGGFDEKESKIIIKVDKRATKQSLRDDFDNYIKNFRLHGLKEKIFISHNPSESDRCLQAVDFIAWAIFQKYEHGNGEYYKIIENKISSKQEMFKL